MINEGSDVDITADKSDQGHLRAGDRGMAPPARAEISAAGGSSTGGGKSPKQDLRAEVQHRNPHPGFKSLSSLSSH